MMLILNCRKRRILKAYERLLEGVGGFRSFYRPWSFGVTRRRWDWYDRNTTRLERLWNKQNPWTGESRVKNP